MRTPLVVVALVVALACQANVTRAQVFTDNFDAFHDWTTGAAPVSGMWTGIYNQTNNGGVVQSNGVDSFATPKPGVLLIESLSPNTGWGADLNNSPLIYRDVDVALNWEAVTKINVQTSVIYSAAGIVARRKGAAVGFPAGSALGATEQFVTAFSFPFTDPISSGGVLSKHIENGVQVADILNDLAGNQDPPTLQPVWLRIIKNGSEFTTGSSLDGTTWFTNAVINAPNLAAAGGTIEVGPTFGTYTGNTGAAEFESFRLQIGLAPTTASTWVPTGSGNWGTSTNWNSTPTPGAPNSNLVVATFGTSITAPSTVYTNADRTVKGIVFNNANKYAIAGTGTITLDADTGNATINVQQGSHEIQAAISLNDNLDITTAAGTRLDINNRMNLNGKTFAPSGPGVVSVNNNLDTGAAGLVANSATLQGSGTINGSLANNAGGVVSPGLATGSGKLSVDGTYTQAASSTLLIELGGTSTGKVDKLAVGGALTAGGILDIDLVGGFTPAAGNSFDILDFASASGAFTYALPALAPGLSWNTSQVLTSGVISVVGAGDADFNNDGFVNGSDFLIWQRNLGATGASNGQGDADGNGSVNAADLAIFKGSFGSATAVVSAVPEPATLLLLTPALAFAALRRRK